MSKAKRKKPSCDEVDTSAGVQTLEVPIAYQVGPWQTRKDVVVQPTPSADVVANHIVLWLGANVPPHRIQSVVGSLRALIRHLKSEGQPESNAITYVHWDEAATGNARIEYISTGPGGTTNNDVGFSFSGTFARSSMAVSNALNHLIDRMIEDAKKAG